VGVVALSSAAIDDVAYETSPPFSLSIFICSCGAHHETRGTGPGCCLPLWCPSRVLRGCSSPCTPCSCLSATCSSC
jgi:hypothetical protein